MNELLEIGVYDGVLLPTDYSEAGRFAFYHALKLAQLARSPLHMLHVTEEKPKPTWEHFPQVRQTLSAWAGKKSSMTSDELAALGIRVKKSVAQAKDPARPILSALRHHPRYLLITAPHPRGSGLLHHSVSINAARKSDGLTLFVPEGSQGFVDEEGKTTLKKILVPQGRYLDGAAAAGLASGFLTNLNQSGGDALLLDFLGGDEIDLSYTGLSWEHQRQDGDPVQLTLDAAHGYQPDLIVLAGDEKRGLFNAFRGTQAERIIHAAPCPVLAIHV